MSMYKQSTNQSTNETIPVRKDERRLINQASYQPVNQQTTNKQSIKDPNEKTIKQSKVNHKKTEYGVVPAASKYWNNIIDQVANRFTYLEMI